MAVSELGAATLKARQINPKMEVVKETSQGVISNETGNRHYYYGVLDNETENE